MFYMFFLSSEGGVHPAAQGAKQEDCFYNNMF